MNCLVDINEKIWNNLQLLELFGFLNTLKKNDITFNLRTTIENSKLSQIKDLININFKSKEDYSTVFSFGKITNNLHCRQVLYNHNDKIDRSNTVNPDYILYNKELIDTEKFTFYKSVFFCEPFLLYFLTNIDINKYKKDGDFDKITLFLYSLKNDNLYTNFSSFLSTIINCQEIYTDNHIGLSIAIWLKKKVFLYNPKNIQEDKKINYLLSFYGIKLSNNNIQYNKNYINILNDCSNNFKEILLFKKAEFNNNKFDILQNIDSLNFQKRVLLDNIKYGFIYNIDKKNTILDISIIQCVFNVNEQQYLAIKKAIRINKTYSNYNPKEWIFVEAGFGNKKYFEYLKEYGILYFYIDLNENQKNIFIKEHLWNIGSKYATSNNLCFLDSDVYYCNCDWIKLTFDAMKRYDLIQNFSISLRENTDEKNSIELGCVCSEYNVRNLKSNTHTGYNITIKKDLFKIIGGFRCCSTSGWDSYFWTYFLSQKEKQFLPYNINYMEKKGYEYNLNIDRKINVGYVDQYCIHVNHTYNTYNNSYYLDRFICHRCNSIKFEDLVFENNTVKWNDNIPARIHRKIKEHNFLKFLKIKKEIRYIENTIENMIEEETIKEYGEINKDNKLLIVTCFNKSAALNNTDIVKKVKDLYDKYLLTPHSFICLTNEKIPGIDTVPIRNNLPNYNCQYEIFRNDFHDKNTSVLYVDLDIIPINYFKINRCPKNKVYLLDEQDITNGKNSKLCAGCVFYNGDYQNVYDYIDKMKYNINRYYNIVQDFIVHGILKYDIEIDNMYKFLSVDFIYLTYSNYLEYYPKGYTKLIHFIGPTKPWNFTKKYYSVFNNILPKNIFNLLNS